MNKLLLQFKYVRFILLLLTTIFLLVGCSASLEEYENTEPTFSIREFFNGELTGWGIVKDYRDKVTRRFVVDMNGRWQDDTGTLYELFKYADGSTQERIWTLTENNDGTVSGTADDVTNTAHGQANGFSFFWNYDLTIQVDGEDLEVHLRDWIYQIDQNTIINQAQIKKFGLPVGEVIVFILKQETSSS